MATNEATKKRLEEIESEIDSLKATQANLQKKWRAEKDLISQIRLIKAESENVKQKADEYERKGELGKVAELRYGKLHEFERRMNLLHTKLEEVQSNGKMLKEEVSAEDIAEVISKATGIPVKKMLEGERAKLLYMEDRIHQRVVSQNEAVEAIANAIRRSRAGLQEHNRPIGSFIFLGTTGVGKTETARALAEFLFDDESAMIRLDMSEYMEKFAVSRLIGAPPGYVGYEEGGQLTEAVRRRPYSVILLDEIEKAHPDVFNILLQVLDDGRLTDGKGRTVNFKNTVIIMTSNLGTEIIQDELMNKNHNSIDDSIPIVKTKIIELLKKTMRPEFLNRIDEIVLFKPLSKDNIISITNIQLESLKKRLSKQGFELIISGEALAWLSELGFDVRFGARPLKRAIQRNISDPLAKLIISGEYSDNKIIRVDYDGDGKFIFS